MNECKHIKIIENDNLDTLYAVSNRRFIINSYYTFIINSKAYLGEVINTKSVNETSEKITFRGTQDVVLDRLKNEGAYYAKIHLLRKVNETFNMENVECFIPTFEDIANVFPINRDSMHLGVIKGTHSIYKTVPNELKNLTPLWGNEGYKIQSDMSFLFNHRKMREYPHVGFFGGSGSGKTFGLRVFCEELIKLNIPGIAFDPHHELTFDTYIDNLDNEFKKGYKDGYQIFHIGKDVGIKFEELQTEELINLYNFLKITEPGKTVINVLHEKGDTFEYFYNKLKMVKDVYDYELSKRFNNKSVSCPNNDSIYLYEKVKSKIPGLETLQAVLWRTQELKNTNIFRSNVHHVENCLLSGKLAVIRGDSSKMLMLSSYIINKTYFKRKHYIDSLKENSKEPFFPAYFLIFDEGHKFMPEGVGTPTKSICKTIAQEARKYGVFLTVATQRAALLDTTIVAQMNTKFIFRTNNSSDLDLIAKETNLSEIDIYDLPNLQSGDCFATSAILVKNFLVRFRTSFTIAPNTADPFDDNLMFFEANNQKTNQLENSLISCLPIRTVDLKARLPEINKKLETAFSIKTLGITLDNMVEKQIIAKENTPFGSEYHLK